MESNRTIPRRIHLKTWKRYIHKTEILERRMKLRLILMRREISGKCHCANFFGLLESLNSVIPQKRNIREAFRLILELSVFSSKS